MSLEARVKKLEAEVGSEVANVCIVVRPVTPGEANEPVQALRYGGKLWQRGGETQAEFVDRVYKSIGIGTVRLIATTEAQERRRLSGKGE